MGLPVESCIVSLAVDFLLMEMKQPLTNQPVIAHKTKLPSMGCQEYFFSVFINTRVSVSMIRQLKGKYSSDMPPESRAMPTRVAGSFSDYLCKLQTPALFVCPAYRFFTRTVAVMSLMSIMLHPTSPGEFPGRGQSYIK